LLGMEIEQVSGRSVEEPVAERIATPLGLTSTAMPTDASLPDPHARALTVQGQDDQVPVDATEWNPSWAWTAGGVISTDTRRTDHRSPPRPGRAPRRPGDRRPRLPREPRRPRGHDPR